MRAEAADLVALLRGLDPPLPGDLDEHTSLLRSGLLDSLALFQLVKWIEDAAGAPIDPMAVDILAEWDTPADAAAFARRCSSG